MIVKLLFDIGILLVGAKILGEITDRLSLTPLVGEVLAGVLLGAILHIITPYESLGYIATLGVVFLMFLIGLSTTFDDIKDIVYPACYIGVVGCALSLVFGIAFGVALPDINAGSAIASSGIVTGFIIGVLILSTSTSVAIRVISEKGIYHSRGGKMLMAANLADTIFAVLAFSALMMYSKNHTVIFDELFKLLLLIIGFIFLISTVGSKIVNRALSSTRYFMDEEILLAVSIFLLFIFSALSENIGLGYIAGAFLAGMAMSKSQFAEPVILPKMKSIGYGFLIPLYFAYSAIFVDVAAFFNFFWVIMALVALGVVAKYVGSGVLSGFFGYHGKEKMMIGVGMIPRGCYNIAIAQIALVMGIISQQLYTVVIGFVLVTIILTPLLFRFVLNEKY
ncbi:MAG: cation:proton antiporter [Candidatus Aenigmatarchaeota archaeon]